MKEIKIFGDPDPKAVAQLENVMRDDRAVAGALMADAHLGYSMPIGGVVAYQDAISPSGVGFDIACGNMAVRTPLLIGDVDQSIPAIMREIQRRVSFGLGRSNPDPIDHPLFEEDAWELPELAPLKQKAQAQLGTVGSGNHYVDLLYDDAGYVWVANHFGSRGLGHTIASGFLSVAQGKSFTDRVKESEEPAVLDLRTYAGDTYLEAMQLAGQYAYAGREYVIDQVLDILGTTFDFSVHNHHNYAWKEDGLWHVRKGATPLDLEPAFIGGSMGDVSAIVRGKWEPLVADGATYAPVVDIGALGSAPHGAGRLMSRTKAAGKMRKFSEERTRPDGTTYTFRTRRRDTSTAAIDWPAVQADLAARGITVLGAGADEAPAAYKDLSKVLAAHENIEVLHWLHPVGVVMAGEDVYDPFKD